MEANRQQTDSILEPLAHLVSKTNLTKIPERVVHQAELSLVDTFGCMVRGVCTEEVTKVIAVEKSLKGQPESTILVCGERVPAISAARSNGYFGDIMEFNDLVGGHAGIGTVSAATAVAEWQKASGEAFLTAVVLGYEVTSRIYNTFYPWKKEYTECCSSPVGGTNTFAAAAIAAKLMGLDESRIQEAMLIAGSLLGTCPFESLIAGGLVKPYIFGGWPASIGIYAAICAREGITGTKTILEGKIGLLNTWAKRFDLRPLSESLGENWALEKPWRKAHACGGYTHSPLDGMLSIVRKHDLRPTDITRVEVGVTPYIIPIVGPAPANARASKFSLKYLLSVAAMTRKGIQIEDTEEAQFDRYLKEGASALMEKIVIYPEESFPHQRYSIVRVLTKGGKEYSERLEHFKGDPENPMTEEEVLDKFRSQVSPVFPGEKAERIISTIYTLRRAPDLSELISVLTKG